MRAKAILGFLMVCLIGTPALATGEGSNDDVVEEVLDLLRERGLMDQATHDQMVEKHVAYRQQQESKLPRIRFSGDFRSRAESFWYSKDALGNDHPNRFRLRYRLRLNGEADVNDWASVHMRIVSGGDDPRSTNETLGSSDDFDSDPIRIAQAYVRVRPPEGSLGPVSGEFEFGKQPNQFLWKESFDKLLWDGDITPEGVSLHFDLPLTDAVRAFANGGYFVIDENSSHKDPFLGAVQAGVHADATDTLSVGGRVSYYQFGSLDSTFIDRAAFGGGPADAGGNIEDGLTGDANGGTLAVLEAGGYVTWVPDEAWPVTVFGNWAQNLDAEKSRIYAGIGKDDTAFSVGLELGNKKKYAQLGAAYLHMEANAFPSVFVDSDIYDGKTNRKSWVFFGKRSMAKNTDFQLTFFVMDDIDHDSPGYDDSVENSDRLRMQADVMYKF